MSSFTLGMMRNMRRPPEACNSIDVRTTNTQEIIQEQLGAEEKEPRCGLDIKDT